MQIITIANQKGGTAKSTTATEGSSNTDRARHADR